MFIYTYRDFRCYLIVTKFTTFLPRKIRGAGMQRCAILQVKFEQKLYKILLLIALVDRVALVAVL